MQFNDPPKQRCGACGAGTQWDTQADYARFVAHMTQTARSRLLRGVAELAAGSTCLLGLIVALAFMRSGVIPLGTLILCFVLLTADGLSCMAASRRIRRFVGSAPLKT